MPWKECHVMHERLRFVARRLEGEKMAPLCAEFGISRKTGYKISARVSRPRRAHLPVSRSDDHRDGLRPDLLHSCRPTSWPQPSPNHLCVEHFCVAVRCCGRSHP